MMKYRAVGNPNPKLYMTMTPCCTSSKLKRYSDLFEKLAKYLAKLPVELNKKIRVVINQNGPYKSGLLSKFSMNPVFQGIKDYLMRVTTSS